MSATARAARAHTDTFMEWMRVGSPEAYHELNAACRGIIRAMKAETGSAWLLDINKGTWVEWDGVEAPRNFCADYVLPTRASEVEALVNARLAAPYTGVKDDAVRARNIRAAADLAGGYCLVWS